MTVSVSLEVFPLDVTVTPDPEVIDLDGVDFALFKDFKRACLSAAVTSSVFLEWLSPAFCIRSSKAESLIFRVFAKSLTVKAKIFSF